MRGATVKCSAYLLRKVFQSTHPLRGATDIDNHPHAVIRNFNPRTPCGVRRDYGVKRMLQEDGFQSTHPLRGATSLEMLLSQKQLISIHAPLAGCDSKIAEIFPENLRKSYKISAKPNKERRCRVLGKGKAAAISGLARCEPPGENRNASGSHQIMSAPSGA